MPMSPAGRALRGRSTRRVAVAAALLSLAPSFSLADKPHAPRADATPLAPPGARVATGDKSVATLLAFADDITRQVSGLRGLKPKRPIERGVLSREEIGARLRERIAKEYTADEIRTEARVLKRLGLLPPEADYQQLLLDLLMEQVAGFYDPFARKLYIADWLGLDMQRPALAHEIEHALQDQHFDLKSFATPLKDDGDRQLARSALVEGDGTAAMLEFFAQSLGVDTTRVASLGDSLGKQIAAGALAQSPVFTRAPRFLRETLLFPYFAGLNFVLALRRDAPWTAVDEAFKNPPESTEQILHPDRYAAHEKPVAITPAPIAALAPRKELRRDVLGELELRVLLATKISDGAAERAAQGWGGDRLVAWGEADESKPVVVIDLSAWDTEDDARDAAAALRQYMVRQLGRKDAPEHGDIVLDGGDGEAWSVERRGREVLAIFGAPSDLRAKVADEVWSEWKVSYPPVTADAPSRGGKPDKKKTGTRRARRD